MNDEQRERYNEYKRQITQYQPIFTQLHTFHEADVKQARIDILIKTMEAPDFWNDQRAAQKVAQERSKLEQCLKQLKVLSALLDDSTEMLALCDEEPDFLDELATTLAETQTLIEKMQFEQMFNHEMDGSNAFLEIQSGSGGTEAQDWASMIFRMYLRWGEKNGFEAIIQEVSDGEVAGIKSATILFKGENAYGWLRTETGVHRLVRKSPFDSGNRRHTSFASVFVTPEIDDGFEIDVNPADVRVDTYRASGAGGQHVNTTDSAVRMTHVPTNTVVQCQNDRSQHKNRDQAMKMLRSKLYELEIKNRSAEKQKLEETKADISWGAQIRSYVLDSARIKDLRTGYETGNTQAVLDGELTPFIEQSLKMGV